MESFKGKDAEIFTRKNSYSQEAFHIVRLKKRPEGRFESAGMKAFPPHPTPIY